MNSLDLPTSYNVLLKTDHFRFISQELRFALFKQPITLPQALQRWRLYTFLCCTNFKKRYYRHGYVKRILSVCSVKIQPPFHRAEICSFVFGNNFRKIKPCLSW